MLIQRVALEQKLLNGVCDVRFVRRLQKPGSPPTRRMLCTKSYELLNSTNGRITLNYRPPSHPKKVNESVNNVLIVWDILMQNYRTINAEEVDLLQEYNKDNFWDFFNNNIYPMSAAQKLAYMDS